MPAIKHTITKGTILSLCSNQDVFDRGERYYRDGKLLSYNETEDTEFSIRATVEGNYKNYEVVLKPDTKGSLTTYECSCESHSIWHGACKHVVAVLFAYLEGHARSFSAAKMRQHANALTVQLEEIIFSGIDEDLAVQLNTSCTALVKLTPTIHCTARGIHLTFTVGRGRMYVVKSIAGFVASCRNGESISYGQGLSFIHTPNMFDELSQKLLDFIMREDDMYSEVGKRIGRQFQFTPSTLTANRELHLTQRNIDEFFEMFAGQTLKLEISELLLGQTSKLEISELPTGQTPKYESGFGDEVALLDAMPPFAINIRHLAAGTVIQVESFVYKFFHGRTNYYVLMGGGLYRITRTEGHVLNALLKSLSEVQSHEILMTGDDRQKFLAIILPQLKQMGIIAAVEGEPPKGEVADLLTKVYLDSVKKDVTAYVKFHYDSLVIDALADNDTAHNVNRDVVAEYAMRRRMLSLGFYMDKKMGMYRLSDDDMLHSFLHGEFSGIESLRKNADVFVSEGLQKKTVRSFSPKLGLRLSGDLLKVSLEDSGYEISELIDALEAYRARKKFYRLKDGRFLTLDDESTSAVAGFIDALDVSGKEAKGKTLTIPSYRALYVDELARKLTKTHTLKRDKGLDTLLEHFKSCDGEQDQNLKFETPESLSPILRGYQKVGFNWLKTLSHYGFGGILADDMGLGKTLQIIALLTSEREDANPSIVVCPTSLLFNWQNEIKRFAPELVTQVISGMPEKRRDLLKTPNVNVFITTYDMLKRDVEHYKIDFAYIIADEAQNIKNPETQAAKSLKELKGKVRFALTGTPIENTLLELWSIFDFIMPGYLHTARKFSRLYEIPIIKYGDVNTAAKLRQQIAPFVLRRIKESVLTELPEKSEITLQAEMLPEQKKVYQATLLETIGTFDEIIAKNEFADNRMRILAQLTRLRQICCHPALFLENYDGGSGKLNLIIETIVLALESGHRVLLFSQFTSMLELIAEAFDRAEFAFACGKRAGYFYLDGSVKSKDRMEMAERFNMGEREVFFISLKAGGTGLNLTGSDVVIHADPWWNPSVMDQASDRAHRYGQKKAVQVFNIVAKDSIEERIMELQEKKRGLIDSVITEGGSFVNLLSEDEVRKLFSI